MRFLIGMRKTVFLLLFILFLVHVSTKDQNCEVLEAAHNCFGDGSVWRGQVQTRQSGAHITIWWQNLLHNPGCVKNIRLFLDGELVKDLEWPDSKQKKIQIPYKWTQCRKHSVLLTVDMEMNRRERSYKALITMTHIDRNNNDENDENCKKVAPGAKNDVAVSSLPPRKEKLRSEKQQLPINL